MKSIDFLFDILKSPSVWREWIEMPQLVQCFAPSSSPSVWREWIEMLIAHPPCTYLSKSPSVWREWIEMSLKSSSVTPAQVSLRVEGVD